MSAIDPKTKGLINLLHRSPSNGEGWREISSTLLSHAHQWAAPHPELFEIVDRDDGTGKIRFTERGQIAVAYL